MTFVADPTGSSDPVGLAIFLGKGGKLFNPIQRKYGEAADIYFALYTQSGNDMFHEVASIPTGDITIAIDGTSATVANSTNAGAKYSNSMLGIYKLTLDVSEMTGKHIDIKIEDATLGKAYKDSYISIETYGHESGQHQMDVDFPTLAKSFITTAAGTTTTIVATGLGITNDIWIDRTVLFHGGNLDGRIAFIEDYTTGSVSLGNTGTLTISQIHTAPTINQSFYIL